MSGTSPEPTEPREPGAAEQPFPVMPSPPPVPSPARPQVPVQGSYQYPAAPGLGQPPGLPAVQPTRGLYTAAAIINWVVLGIIIVATLGIGVIAAAWYVPMTIQIHKGAKGPYKHTALGVCTLLFCGLIPGILMLVDDANRPEKPRVYA